MSGIAITAGTTPVTLSIATLATADTPSNPDITDVSLPVASLEQLLLTCAQLGAFELFATPVGTLSDSADGAWVESTKTLTPSTAPNWVVNALVGLPIAVNSTSVGTVVSNTATALVTSVNGSVTNGTYAWSITSPNMVLCEHYAYAGDFYNFISSIDAAPFAGSVSKIRFYNNSTQAQTMSVGALLS